MKLLHWAVLVSAILCTTSAHSYSMTKEELLTCAGNDLHDLEEAADFKSLMDGSAAFLDDYLTMSKKNLDFYTSVLRTCQDIRRAQYKVTMANLRKAGDDFESLNEIRRFDTSQDARQAWAQTMSEDVFNRFYAARLKALLSHYDLGSAASTLGYKHAGIRYVFMPILYGKPQRPDIIEKVLSPKPIANAVVGFLDEVALAKADGQSPYDTADDLEKDIVTAYRELKVAQFSAAVAAARQSPGK